MGYLNEDGLATLVGKVKGQVVQLTQAEYMQIPESEKNHNNKLYFVEDEEFSWKIDDEPTLNSDGLAKSGGIYTYTSKIGSGTLTTTAQTIIPAINELDAAIDTINAGLIHPMTRNLGPLAVNGTTVQIPNFSSLSGDKIVVLNLHRYAYAGTISTSVATIMAGDFASGTTVFFQSSSKYVVITISVSGLITMTNMSADGAPYVDVVIL